MKVDKSIPWVRFLFTGYIEDTGGYISQYRFTTINYNPEGCNKRNLARISEGHSITVPREKIREFLSANRGAILGDLDFDGTEFSQFKGARQRKHRLGRYLEIVFYLDEDANNRLWYVSGSNGNVLFTRTFEEVYEKYQGILSGEVVLLDSEFFSQNFKTVIAAREDMLERLKLIDGRSRITGQNLSKLSVSGYDHEEGEALVHAEGLTGESKTGVNVYPDVVSEVTVPWEDLMPSRVKVFDFSRCRLLRSFEIGDARFTSINSNESISLIFSGSAQRRAYGSFYPEAKEVRVVGTDSVLFKDFISKGGHVTVDGEIFAENLSLKDCTGLSTLKVRACHGEDGYGCPRKEEGYSKSKIELVNLDTEHLEVDGLEIGLGDELEISGCKDLKYLKLSFIGLPEEDFPFDLTDFVVCYGGIRGMDMKSLERLTIDARYSGYCLSDDLITHFDTAFPNLVELNLIGRLTNKLNERLEYECRLKVTKGCKVNCGDEELAREFIFHE